MARCGTYANTKLETFSKTVEAIYSCASDASRWQSVLSTIKDFCGSHYGVMAIFHVREERLELLCSVGYPEQYQRYLEDKFAHGSIYLERLQKLPVATVATRSMLLNERTVRGCSNYREFLSPLKISDAIGFTTMKSRNKIALLAFHRHRSHGKYSFEDLRSLSLLAPHICRSMSIGDLLDLSKGKTQSLEAALEAMSFGVYLTDRDGRILFMNRAGDRQVRTSDALRIGNTHLAPINKNARAKLAAAISTAARNEPDARQDNATVIALPGEESPGMVATILPLSSRIARRGFEVSGPTAAVFVQDPLSESLASGEGFAQLFGLTSSELRVLLAMLPGLSAKEAAEQLGISESTAKTHLQHIHAKTGATKHSELMRMFVGSAPPIYAGAGHSQSPAETSATSSSDEGVDGVSRRKLNRQFSGAKGFSMPLLGILQLEGILSEISGCCLLSVILM